MFLHDRIHKATYKNNLWKACFQFFIYPVQITAQKMMQTDCKKKYCFWFLFQFIQYIGHTLYRYIFQVSVQKIFFFYDHEGKSFCRIHLSCCQNHSTHAVICTDINLDCLGHQHSGVYNVPVSMCG